MTFKVKDIAIAEGDNIMTGLTKGLSYTVLTVKQDYIEICTDYGRYEWVSSLYFTKG